MNTRIISAAAAVLLATTALVCPSAFAADPGPAQQVTTAPVLEKLTTENYRQTMNGDKPVFVIVTGANCSTCPALAAQIASQAAKHSGVNFLEANGADFGVPDEVLPLAITIVPGVGQTYSAKNLAAPADISAYVAQRVDLATKTQAAGKAVADVEAKIATASEPFDKEESSLADRAEAALQPLRDQAGDIAKPFRDQLADVAKRRDEAISPLREAVGKATNEAEYTAAMQKLREAARPFGEEATAIRTKMSEALKPLQEKAAEVLKPLQEEATKIEERKTAALAPLNEELAKAQAALDEITAQDK